MSQSDKLTAGLLKLAFGQFEAPVGTPVFGDTPQPHILPGAKPESKKKEKPPAVPNTAQPVSMDRAGEPPAEPKAPLEPMGGPNIQEIRGDLPFLGEIGRYFRSIFTKEQK